jgi:acid phosphatase type 7
MRSKITQWMFICILFTWSTGVFAEIGFYRATWKDDPSTSLVIGWTGDEATFHFGTTDEGTNYAAYPNSIPTTRAVVHRNLNNKFVELTGLQPKTTYYGVLRTGDGELSRRLKFTTMSDNPDDCISFVSGGDTRDYIFFPDATPPPGINSWRDVRQEGFRLLSKVRPDFIAFSGDFIGGQYQQGVKTVRKQWEEWLEDWQATLEPDGRLLPIIPSLGNHEEYDTEALYEMFNIASSTNYFSLTFGGNLLKIYTLSSALTENSASHTAQNNWLENSLANDTLHGSGQIIWKAAQYHKPMYAFGGTYTNESHQISGWASRFQTFGVRIGMEGHSHSYKVTWPAVPFGNNVNRFFQRDDFFGTVYLGEGNMGAPMRQPKSVLPAYSREASGAFSSFFFLVVNKDSITVRTVIIENEITVAQLTDDEQCSDLPAGVSLYDASRGAVNGDVVVYPFGQDRVTIPTGIKGNDLVEYATVYPNPVSDLLYLQFNSSVQGHLTLEIYNALGQLKDKKELRNVRSDLKEVNMKGYTPGAYYILLKSKDAAQTVKVIKQ